MMTTLHMKDKFLALDDGDQAGSKHRDSHRTFVLDLAKGCCLYMVLYLIQRGEHLTNALRGKPNVDHDGW
jgi:hypothetical protein